MCIFQYIYGKIFSPGYDSVDGMDTFPSRVKEGEMKQAYDEVNQLLMDDLMNHLLFVRYKQSNTCTY